MTSLQVLIISDVIARVLITGGMTVQLNNKVSKCFSNWALLSCHWPLNIWFTARSRCQKENKHFIINSRYTSLMLLSSCFSFVDQADRLAAGLLSLGLKKGDRVGMLGPNSREWVITQYATARAGLILVGKHTHARKHTHKQEDYKLDYKWCSDCIYIYV